MYKISIEDNLKRLFTTTLGAYPLDGDFGMPHKYLDRAVHTIPIIDLKDYIIKAIQKYEPRINILDANIKLENNSLIIKIITEQKEYAIELSNT